MNARDRSRRHEPRRLWSRANGTQPSNASAEERLQLALAAAQLGTFSWYPAEDRTDADERMLTIFGLSTDGSITLASALGELIHSADAERYAGAVAACLDPIGPGDLNEDIRVARADGERWVHVRGRVTFCGEPRRAERLDGVVMDITDQKEAERTLRESQERLVLALHAARQGTFVWYPLEDHGEPDIQMLELLGLGRNEPLRLTATLSAIIHPDDRETYAEALARAIDPSGDGALRHDLRIVMPDGHERWVEIAAQTTFQGDTPRAVRMAGVATDISERKQAEARDAEARQSEARLRLEQQRSELATRDLASRFQRSLMPKLDTPPPGVRVSSLYLPGERRMLLGGDFLDARTAPDGSIALLIGDVAGHGPEAASLAVALRASWRAVLLSGATPATAVAALNEIALAEQTNEEAFATVCVCEIDARATELVWTSAGHPAPIVEANGEIRQLLGDVAPPLGIGPREAWPTNHEALLGASRIFLYTDGLVEGRALRAAHERFGLDGLIASLEKTFGAAIDHTVLTRLVDHITLANGELLHDDVAILAVETQLE
jgi:PAS domain S-box-containing protein